MLSRVQCCITRRGVQCRALCTSMRVIDTGKPGMENWSENLGFLGLKKL